MAQSLNALAVGALVKDTGTLYNGKPIIWKIADKGHTGYPSGAVTLITERIISLKCFDATTLSNSPAAVLPFTAGSMRRTCRPSGAVRPRRKCASVQR